jgi:hypothetical protein
MNNLMLLDDLCAEHVEHEAHRARMLRGADAAQEAHEPHPTVEACLAHVRALFMRGELDSALAAVEALAPGALRDPSFQLDLKLHHLDELVHATYTAPHPHPTTLVDRDPPPHALAHHRHHDYTTALHYARTVLAPYAQEAFPEAVRFVFASTRLVHGRCLLAAWLSNLPSKSAYLPPCRLDNKKQILPSEANALLQQRVCFSPLFRC